MPGSSTHTPGLSRPSGPAWDQSHVVVPGRTTYRPAIERSLAPPAQVVCPADAGSILPQLPGLGLRAAVLLLSTVLVLLTAIAVSGNVSDHLRQAAVNEAIRATESVVSAT